jgi:hypothetical protein
MFNISTHVILNVDQCPQSGQPIDLTALTYDTRISNCNPNRTRLMTVQWE